MNFSFSTKYIRHFFLAVFCLITIGQVRAQSQEDFPSIDLRRTTEKITLDGILDEASWFTGTEANGFWQNFPTDSSLAQGRTEVYMTYDENFLYVATKCYSSGDSYITPSLKRDFSFPGNDNVSILFDTFNDQTNAFLFGMNPFGVQREALISNGGLGFNDFSESWDNKWYGEAKIHNDHWIAEFAIPFNTLRFKSGTERWRFNCYRFDTQNDEITTWIKIPQNLLVMNLAYMGDMNWEEPLTKSGRNISVIPYVIGESSRDFTDPNQTKANNRANIGGDAKIALGPGLNLDLTVNPDFSQVEVDQQVSNLQRFEIFFPEKRQFFLENADLFSSFGNVRINPFFSRRIGVAIDTATGQNIQNPIQFGARLSGKLTERSRIGLLNMQSAPLPSNGLPAFNHTVAALQQQVMKRSNLAFFVTNKQAINASERPGQYSLYNRVVGGEYRIGSVDNTWTGKIFYHQAFTPSEEEDKFAHGFQIEYLKRHYRLEWAHIYVGQGYDAEMGFVPRRDFFLMSPEAEMYVYPKKGNITQHTIGFDSRFIYKPGNDGNLFIPRWGRSDVQVEAAWQMQFKDFSTLELGYQFDNLILFNDFDPTRVQRDGIFLPAGSPFTFHSFNADYTSDPSKTFFYQATPTIGQFYNGFRGGVSGSLTYRYQPFGFVSMDFSYDYVKLAEPFEATNILLVGPRIDLTFNRKLFLTTFIQYNNQLDNLNINARLQWRFAPVSDFFIVYTDNYLTDPFSQFSVRNRGITAKLTYWLNL